MRNQLKMSGNFFTKFPQVREESLEVRNYRPTGEKSAEDEWQFLHQVPTGERRKPRGKKLQAHR